ncbi:MAG TPA: hypothetical protein VFA18_05710 [Gemmataceae bacterium]|nr:hypothetical protein [Gemmataceae bacterium]
MATKTDNTPATAIRPDAHIEEFAFSSNAIRLSGRQWVVVGLLALAMIVGLPRLWKKAETFTLEPDYRMPYALSTDYWLYDRYARAASEQYDVLLVGDSVIWGQYVDRQHTLAHELNQLAGRERFANLGLDGVHPAALAGLLEYYGRGIEGKKVVLFCNPLWLSSPRHDLQESEKFDFNHPDLVPQFGPWIPCYKAETTKRIGRVVDRTVPFRGWTNHLQQAYFGGSSIPAWTLEHPSSNPVQQFRHGLPASDNRVHSDARPWTKKHIRPANMPWVEPDTSFQWHSFQRAVQLLQERHNDVFVLVGPFNEHMLTPRSRQRYEHVKERIKAWLEAQRIAYDIPEALPTEEYADASHPLAAGYARLARRLNRQGFFARQIAPTASAP